MTFGGILFGLFLIVAIPILISALIINAKYSKKEKKEKLIAEKMAKEEQERLLAKEERWDDLVHQMTTNPRVTSLLNHIVEECNAHQDRFSKLTVCQNKAIIDFPDKPVGDQFSITKSGREPLIEILYKPYDVEIRDEDVFTHLISVQCPYLQYCYYDKNTNIRTYTPGHEKIRNFGRSTLYNIQVNK